MMMQWIKQWRKGNRVAFSWRRLALFAGASLLIAFVLATALRLAPLPTTPDLDEAIDKSHAARRAQVLAVDGEVLNRTYTNHWNIHDRVALHDIPQRLRAAFLGAEDRRFFQHMGIDWPARAAAVVQNLKALRAVRGASTISEQSVRMLYPRPRTVWSRWLEGIDAMRLEHRFGKTAVLEFYLNQVPFAANRRGVVQAARHYFDRDLQTLSVAEMLTLAVLVRAPSRLDPWRRRDTVRAAVQRLAAHLHEQGVIDRHAISSWTLTLSAPTIELNAAHAVRYALAEQHRTNDLTKPITTPVIRTSLHTDTQRSADRLLRRRLAQLQHRGVQHGAVLVADHRRGVIRAWVSANAPNATASNIDAVTTPRQPGSTLKPFVYAMAMSRGWNAATMINDAPFAQSVGRGQHDYRNYSRVHYGKVSVRNALGNSLNVPAVKALAQVGTSRMLQQLHDLGLHSLTQTGDYYGDGLALGNGEVTLLELTTAYASLARGGVYQPLRLSRSPSATQSQVVMDAEISAIITDILADPNARALEFGSGGVLSLPTQTAVKTGTSNDHRDAWAIGYDHRHVVGVWMGDLQRQPMDRISGSSGPALVMRALFAHLNRDQSDERGANQHGTKALHKPRSLQRLRVCADDGLAPHNQCTRFREEWFTQTDIPQPADLRPAQPAMPRIRRPGPGLRLAIDPRVPLDAQRFRFALSAIPQHASVRWFIDGEMIDGCDNKDCLWTLQTGHHTLYAQVRTGTARDQATLQTSAVSFVVH